MGEMDLSSCQYCHVPMKKLATKILSILKCPMCQHVLGGNIVCGCANCRENDEAQFVEEYNAAVPPRFWKKPG